MFTLFFLSCLGSKPVPTVTPDQFEELRAQVSAQNDRIAEQQKAIDFFNRYNKESKEQQEVAEKQTRTFLNKTNQLFNKDFKGFEYNVGDKKFRFSQRIESDGTCASVIKAFKYFGAVIDCDV